MQTNYPTPVKPAAEVWDVVNAENKDLSLGLQLGEKINPSILGLMGYLMQCSRTLHKPETFPPNGPAQR